MMILLRVVMKLAVGNSIHYHLIQKVCKYVSSSLMNKTNYKKYHTKMRSDVETKTILPPSLITFPVSLWHVCQYTLLIYNIINFVLILNIKTSLY